MKTIHKLGYTSYMGRFKLVDVTSTTEGGKTGLLNTTTGLSISTIADNESSAATNRTYTAAAATIDAIATPGTYAAPSTGHCRFGEVDATGHPGLYEVQLRDERLTVASAKSLVVTIVCPGVGQVDAELQLVAVDVNDAAAFGLSRLDAAVSGVAAAVWAVATSSLATAGQIGKFILDKLNQSFALQSDTTAINSSIATLNSNAGTILNAVNAITTNTARGKLILPPWMEIPDSGSATYEFDLNIYSLQGQLEAPDAAPTIHARKADGTSLDPLLASTTMTLVSTGRYKVTFSFLSSQAKIQALVDAAWAVGGVPFAITDTSPIVDAETITTLLAIKAKTDNLPAQPAAAGDRMDLVNAPNATAIAAIQNGLMLTTDKSGYKLAAHGLDAVSTTGPNGVATNFRERVNQLWRRFFGKTVRTATQINTYRDDNATVATNQDWSSTGGTQSVDEAVNA